MKNFLSFCARDTPQRREFEQGELLILPAERASQLFAPLETCLQDEPILSVILVPIKTDQSVVGLLGLGMPRRAEPFAAEEANLLKRMALDLSDLAEYARLNETAQELAATERAQPPGARPARLGDAGALLRHLGSGGAA